MAQRIRELRAKNDLTLEQVAEVVGVGKSTVRKWETGMIANMRRDKIAVLAKALKTTPEYLMGWSDSPDPEPEQKANPAADPEKHSAPELSAEEQEAVSLLAGLDPAAKAHALQLLRSLAALQGKDSDSRE